MSALPKMAEIWPEDHNEYPSYDPEFASHWSSDSLSDPTALLESVTLGLAEIEADSLEERNQDEQLAQDWENGLSPDELMASYQMLSDRRAESSLKWEQMQQTPPFTRIEISHDGFTHHAKLNASRTGKNVAVGIGAALWNHHRTLRRSKAAIPPAWNAEIVNIHKVGIFHGKTWKVVNGVLTVLQNNEWVDPCRTLKGRQWLARRAWETGKARNIGSRRLIRLRRIGPADAFLSMLPEGVLHTTCTIRVTGGDKTPVLTVPWCEQHLQQLGQLRRLKLARNRQGVELDDDGIATASARHEPAEIQAYLEWMGDLMAGREDETDIECRESRYNPGTFSTIVWSDPNDPKHQPLASWHTLDDEAGPGDCRVAEGFGLDRLWDPQDPRIQPTLERVSQNLLESALQRLKWKTRKDQRPRSAAIADRWVRAVEAIYHTEALEYCEDFQTATPTQRRDMDYPWLD